MRTSYVMTVLLVMAAVAHVQRLWLLAPMGYLSKN